MENILVSIVEDDAAIREELRALVSHTPGFTCMDAFGNAEDAATQLGKTPADLVIMDIGLPGMSGVECIRRLKALGGRMQYMVFTIYEDSLLVYEALAAGAGGYLLKNASPEKIIEALRELHEGGAPMSTSIAKKVVASFLQPDQYSPLSAREMEVLQLLAKGLLYKEVALGLSISTGTVRQHIHRIYEKLHVQNRTEALNKVFGQRK